MNPLDKAQPPKQAQNSLATTMIDTKNQ